LNKGVDDPFDQLYTDLPGCDCHNELEDHRSEYERARYGVNSLIRRRPVTPARRQRAFRFQYFQSEKAAVLCRQVESLPALDDHAGRERV
jgi:hypothetical protein